MKNIKKFLGIFVVFSLVLFLNACGCGKDETWALKSGDLVATPGMYKYYLLEGKNRATELLTKDGVTPETLEGQTIEGLPVKEWLHDYAKSACGEFLAVEKLFSEKKLNLTEEENKKADEIADTFWQTSGQSFETDKISKADFGKAHPIFTQKTEKLFLSYYGEEGENSVSDEDLTAFYGESFANIRIMSTSVGSEESAEGGNSTNNQETSAETIEEVYKSYVELINSGQLTVAELNQKLKEKDQLDFDPIAQETVNLKEFGMPDEIKSSIANLQAGGATYIKYGKFFLFICKEDIKNSMPNLENDTTRHELLHDMKDNEFKEIIANTIKNMNPNVNDAVIKEIDPLNLASGKVSNTDTKEETSK